jgi:hypothetical protein
VADFPVSVAGNGLEAIGIDSANSGGVTVTASGSADTKGSYTQLIAATTFEYAALTITITHVNPTIAFLVDIAIGAAASEVVLIPDIFLPRGWTDSTITPIRFTLPIAVPAGSRVSARCAGTTGGLGIRVSAVGVAPDPIVPSSGSSVWAVKHATLSKGIVVDAGGSANTKGSWVELVASTVHAAHWLQVLAGRENTIGGAINGWLLDIAVGAAASEVVLIPDLFFAGESTRDQAILSMGVPCDIPAGSRIAARCQSDNATVNQRELLVALLGVG